MSGDAQTVIVRDGAGVAQVNQILVDALPRSGSWGVEVRISRIEAPHTSAQRALLFALCGDIARQLPFPAGGRAKAEDWKSFLVGLHRGETMVRDGDVVVIVGGSTSGATRSEMSDVIGFVEAWGATRGVKFSAPKGWA